MRHLGRWAATDTRPISAHPDAYLVSPLDDLARSIAGRGTTPARTSRTRIVDHVYIDVPAPSRPTRAKVYDAPRQPAARPRGRDRAKSEHLCTVSQNGETAEFSAIGPNDEPLRVETAKSGGIEVWRDPEEGDQGDNVFGQTSPPGTLDRLRRRFGPKQRVGDAREQEAEMRNMQAYLDELHRPKS